jgi:transcriptional regulator with XRE-family HTH domain
MNTVIQILKQARKAKQFSQTDLSKALGLPQSHISKIESGKTDLRLSNLENMAHVLGFELMLVPKLLVPYVQASIDGRDVSQTPRWQPDENDDEQLD